VLQDAAVEARDYQRKVARDMDAKARQAVTKAGVQINEVAPQEIERMRAKVKPVIDKYAAQVGEALVKEFYGELEKARKAK
jgi:TRAP-type C4-dicarboxylate transport system substrate-binding protein